MQSLAGFVLLAVLASPALAQTPTVSLLIDNGYASSGTLNIKSTLTQVKARKGTFHFGSTYETSYPSAWTKNIYQTYFDHAVAENSCKWQNTEPSRGTSSLGSCQAVQSYVTGLGGTFRGHNTFWHSQTPSWLPGSVSASDLVTNVIPQHVQQEIQGMGSSVTSWDVMNEIVGDNPSNGMTALQCVQNKGDWPNYTSDGSGRALVTDLSYIHAAFSTANQYAPAAAPLVLNDYSTGTLSQAKTACQFAILADIVANANVPYSRLAIGFQSHVSAAPYQFSTKSDLAATFSKLAGLGARGLITELDIKISGSNSANLRYQAAIWGDYLDACLYASNCVEFVNWNTRDDQSWLGASGAGTLFDTNGNPKPAAYEVAARLARYAAGAPELCATAAGTGSCTVPSGVYSSTGTGTATTSTVGTTTTVATTTDTTTTVATTTTVGTTTTTATTTPSGCSSSMYGQCGGTGWAGCTSCASGSTCKYSNPYYSQCL